jgi:hypothetical protein
MKLFLFVIALLWAGAGSAAEKPAAPQGASLSGKVLEVQHAASFTYLRLKTQDGETWAATPRAQVEKGADVRLDQTTVMTNFQSRSLNRKFDKIVFGRLAGAGAGAPTTHGDMSAVHGGLGAPAQAADLKVPKASGPNARTVAEIVQGKDMLKDKTVLVRGKVVKYNPGILGKNWIHLRDGSGSAAERTNDVLVTSKSETKIGDVVLVKGVVRTHKDFGAGYSYPVMIEAVELAGK